MDLKFYSNVAQIGNNILVRGYDRDGKQASYKVKYSPSIFLESEDGNYRTLDGHVVKRVTKPTIAEAREFYKKHSDSSNFNIYGYEQYPITFINEEFNGKIDYDPNLIRVANIDIETASDEGMPDIETANKPITAITVQMGPCILSLGCGDFVSNDEDVTYVKCEDEKTLIENFLDAWEFFNPDVVTGWNILGFDIPYIVNRTKAIIGETAPRRLSPWGYLREKEVLEKNKVKKLYYPVGVAVLDYMKIYKKMELEPRESYALNFIASVEVGAKKLDYSEYENLFSLYKNNFQKFMEYNIIDVRLVGKIEDKKRMLDLTYQMAYSSHCNFEDINSPVRTWEAKIYNDLMDRNIVFPPRQNITAPSYRDDPDGEAEHLEGGYVKEPVPGKYEWVVSIDLKSSYPHQIMMYGISPETFRGKRQTPYNIEDYLALKDDPELEDIRKQELIVAPNGCLYDRNIEGFLPRLLSKDFDLRDEFKKVMNASIKEKEKTKDANKLKQIEDKIADYKNKQMVYKVSLNSAYGALSNKWFRFYNFDLADTVTSCGRLAVRWAEKHVNEYMNRLMLTENVDYVIAMDTDSLYLNLGPFVEKKYGKGPFSPGEKNHIVDLLNLIVKNKFEPHIADCYRELQKRVNAPTQKLVMNRESIADVGIWTGKKRYVLSVLDKEQTRFSEPKIMITGLDSVRSSTPSACRDAIKKFIKLIIETNDETKAQEFIAKFRDEFDNLPFDEIAFPRGINGMDEYADETLIYRERTPVQVRGALVYNQMLQEKGITNFSPIWNGDKAKFCYLKTPNSVRSYVITVPHTLPKAFNLDDKIDRDKQFEVAFLNPITTIMEAIGWKIEDEGNTLDNFMMGKV